jgi:hypothetical protein
MQKPLGHMLLALRGSTEFVVSEDHVAKAGELSKKLAPKVSEIHEQVNRSGDSGLRSASPDYLLGGLTAAELPGPDTLEFDISVDEARVLIACLDEFSSDASAPYKRRRAGELAEQTGPVLSGYFYRFATAHSSVAAQQLSAVYGSEQLVA